MIHEQSSNYMLSYGIIISNYFICAEIHCGIFQDVVLII